MLEFSDRDFIFKVIVLQSLSYCNQKQHVYTPFPKLVDRFTVNILKIRTLKQASDKMTYTNSVDPDQTAPEGAVWSGSKLFAIPLNI